nr:hypothetical protein [Paracoccus aestuariivivens]
MAEGGSGVVISSQSGYRMPALSAEQDAVLATAPTDDLLALDFVKSVCDTLHAYQMSKRCNSLRVRGEAINWAKRGARINAIRLPSGLKRTRLASLGGCNRQLGKLRISEVSAASLRPTKASGDGPPNSPRGSLMAVVADKRRSAMWGTWTRCW